MDELLADEGIERPEYDPDVGHLPGMSYLYSVLRIDAENTCSQKVQTPSPSFISTFVAHS